MAGTRPNEAEHRFAFRFADSYRLPALLFGVTPRTTEVVVRENGVRVRFGPWLVTTPLANVVDARLTGPYSFLKTAGPAHLSLTDRGLTFATNGEAGVCLQFLEPVAGIDPVGLLRHPGLTVTVADCDGLIEAVNPPRSTA